MKRFAGVIAVLAAAVGSASGADMTLKASPLAAARWTGLYLGVNVGYGWGDPHTGLAGSGDVVVTNVARGFPSPPVLPLNFAFANSGSAPLKGLLGGVQIGYNYQLDRRWVVGVEADLQGAGQSESNAFTDQFSTQICSGTPALGSPCVVSTLLAGTAATGYEARVEWFGTLRGRAGYLITDQVLLYGTGGLAYGRVRISGNAGIASATLIDGSSLNAPATGAFAVARNNLGYSIGAGVEGRIFPWLPANWTWKAEYLYLDLGSLDSGTSFSGLFPSISRDPTMTSSLTGTAALHSQFVDHIVRVGLNYKFGN